MKLILLAPFALVGLILQTAFILNEKMERYKKAVVLKGLASAVFVAMGVIGALLSNAVITPGALNGAKPVALAAKNNITKGYSSGAYAGKFGVGLKVKREDIVTFMYRYKVK